jgi:Mrp family chromosome partitioning ATPase
VEVPDEASPLPGVDFAEPVTVPAGFRAPDWHGPVQSIDRIALAEGDYLLPDGPVTAMSEEFRLLKRDLLAQLGDDPRGNRILVCSAHSGEGKSFCAVNLALVDADFGKPGIPEALGLTAGCGLMDALADPAITIENCVIRTDIPSLSVLPSGRPSNNDTEYLASARTDALLNRLTEGRPDRIILFDSPPLLAASAGAVLASHAAIALLVVRADQTSESALRDAAGMLKGAGQVQLLLNGVTFSGGGRRFGSYPAKGGEGE